MHFIVSVPAISRGLIACALATFLCVASQSVAPQNTAPQNAAPQSIAPPVRGEGNPPPDIPLTRWLEGPTRQDFPWRVELGPPWLTFQQRRYVQASVTFRVRDLLKAGVSLSDLHVIVKLATEDGHWLPGQSYNHFDPPPNLDPASEIHAYTGLYVRQGAYKVVVLAYDSAHQRGNLWRGLLRVEPLREDPLPGIESDLPQVEFLHGSQALRIRRGRGRAAEVIAFDPWTLGQGKLVLPVDNARPVQVDIVTNLSLSVATDRRYSEAPDWQYQLNGAALMQIANVLSQLDFKTGCVRLSALDVRRQKIFVDRQDARNVDWSHLRESIAKVNRIKIEAKTLAGEKHEPAFLAHYLEQLLTRPSSCPAHDAPALHILVLVSDAFIFPDGAEMTTVRPHLLPPGLCYHLRVVPVAGPRWDEVSKVVKALHPIEFDFSSSSRFRKTLAQLIARIEKASRQSDRPAQ